MTETILQLLTRLSEAGNDAVLSGAVAESHYGSEFDRLLRKRVLVEAAPISHWDVCDRCECGTISRPIRQNGDQYQADCPLDPREDVVLSAEDIRSFRINFRNLAMEIAAMTGLRGQPGLMAAGLWDLGQTASGRCVFLIFDASFLNMDGLVPIIGRSSKLSAATLIAPLPPPEIAAHLIDAGIHVVAPSDVVAKTSGEDQGRNSASILDPPPETPELVLDPQSATVIWRGTSVVLSHQLLPVFKRLVEKALSRDPVASGPFIEGSTGREAKDLVRELREAFRSAGFSADDVKSLFQNVRGRGYRLGVAAGSIRESP